MQRDKTEELFRKKLAEYEWPEAIPAWEEVSGRLPRAVSPVSFWRVAVAACLIVAAGGWLSMLFFQTSGPISESGPLLTGGQPVGQGDFPVADSVLKEPVDDAFIAQVHLKASGALPALDVIQISEELPHSATFDEKDVPLSEEDSPQLICEPDPVREQVGMPPNERKAVKEYNYPVARKKKESTYSLGLIASNFSTSDKKGAHPTSLMHSAYRPPVQVAGDENGQIRASLDKNRLSGFDHRLPVRVGFTASYEVIPHLSLETGLLYSYHYSNFNRLDKAPVKGTQKLHYLGLPLNLIYNIVGNQRFRLYGGLGGEMNINLHSSQRYTMAGQTVSSDFREKEPVWGAGLKAGGAYRLLKEFEIYVEPAVMKYWSRGDLHTRWTDESIVFSLNFGLRTLF